MARSGLVMLAGLAVGMLSAGSLAQNQVTLSNPGSAWRAGGFAGGAFLVTHVAGYVGQFGGPGGGANSFLSFCLERNENIGLPQTSYADIGLGAVNGGIAGGNPDPVSHVTAWMYYSFRNSLPFGAAGVIDTAAETRSLQRALWFSEQEFDGTEAEWTGDALAQQYYNWAVANADGAMHGVRALRLWSSYNASTGQYSGNRQDQLTIIPLPPAAWAGLGSLCGVMAIGYVRRRKHLS